MRSCPSGLFLARHGRPPGGDRHVFFRAVGPVRPISRVAVSACAKHYLVKAGIQVPRPGSHTPSAVLAHVAVVSDVAPNPSSSATTAVTSTCRWAESVATTARCSGRCTAKVTKALVSGNHTCGFALPDVSDDDTEVTGRCRCWLWPVYYLP